MEMGFLIKKFLSFFLEPIGMVLTLLGFALFYIYRDKKKRAKYALMSAFVLLFLFSYPPFANYLIEGLENRYTMFDYSQETEYIHVLGNSHTVDAKQPLTSQLSNTTIKRVVEGVVIHKKYPKSKIIFTGYSGQTEVSNAQMNAELAKLLGVKYENMLINPLPKDTREEALFTQSIVGNKAFVLVTSASHMPRSMMLFESLGMHPIAAPTNFYKEKFDGYLYAPDAYALHISTVAMHEYFGMLLEKIRALLK